MSDTATAAGAVSIEGAVHRHPTVLTWVGTYSLLAISLGLPGVLGELRDELAISDTVTSLHGSFFGWGLLLGGLGGHRLVARVGRRSIVRLAGAGLGLGSVIVAVGHHVAWTLTGAAIVGSSAAALVVVIPGIVADQFGERRHDVFTLVNMAPALAGLLYAVILGVAIGSGLGWRWPLGLIPLVIAVVLAKSLRIVSYPPEIASTANPVRLLGRSSMRTRWGLLVVAIMVEFANGVWAPAFLKEVGGASAGMAPALGALVALGILLGRWMLPWATRRFGTWVEVVSFAAAATAAVLAWLAPWLAVRAIGLGLVGLGIGPLYLIGIDRLFHHGGDDTVSVSALGALASGTAVTVGPLLIGTMADTIGLQRAYGVVPVLAFAGALWAFALRRREVVAGNVQPPTVG